LVEDREYNLKYFGNPIYTYSLRQGIEDGFLARYKVVRIVTDADALGYTPEKGKSIGTVNSSSSGGTTPKILTAR
jgi:type I site-specific restriction endonuclease